MEQLLTVETRTYETHILVHWSSWQRTSWPRYKLVNFRSASDSFGWLSFLLNFLMLGSSWFLIHRKIMKENCCIKMFPENNSLPINLVLQTKRPWAPFLLFHAASDSFGWLLMMLGSWDSYGLFRNHTASSSCSYRGFLVHQQQFAQWFLAANNWLKEKPREDWMLLERLVAWQSMVNHSWL